MEKSRFVTLDRIITEFSLEVLFGVEGYGETKIFVDSVDRPGLQLVGFFEHFESQRVQLLGNMEYGYLQNLTHEQRLDCFDKLLAYEIPALIWARGLEPFPECLEMAKKHGRTILRTNELTGDFMSTLTATLKNFLSPRITRHGVLVEVYGEGILLTGESGVGKSETAVELLKRGHRLIADDAVEITRSSAHSLMGTSPALIRYYMELRGIGVIDVRHLFGMSAVKESTRIDMIIHIEQWKDNGNYDRIGLDNHTTSVLDVDVPIVTVPVKPGRNLAVIIEVAALNNRQKKMGYNAAEEFTRQINAHFEAEQAKWK
jgi:HPr kinase/phosphorylase